MRPACSGIRVRQCALPCCAPRAWRVTRATFSTTPSAYSTVTSPVSSMQTATILAEFSARFAASRAMHEEALAVLPGGMSHDIRRMRPFPIFVERAQGAHKWDVDGHELIDYQMGHGALLLGHAHPSVVQAVQDQAGRGMHLGAGHPLEVEWARQVIGLVPSADRVRFNSSGTE